MSSAEKELWGRYKVSRSVTDRNELVLFYLHLAQQGTRKYVSRQSFFAYDEVFGSACEGLIRAIEGFDVNRGIPFESFSRCRIQGSIKDFVRSQDDKSKSVRMFQKQRNRLNLDQMPVESAAKVLSLPISLYVEYCRMADLSFAHASHWQDYVLADRGEHFNMVDSMDYLDYAFAGLSSRDRYIMQMFCVDNLSAAEIGRTMKLSPSRVGQIIAKSLQHARSRIEIKEAA